MTAPIAALLALLAAASPPATPPAPSAAAPPADGKALLARGRAEMDHLRKALDEVLRRVRDARVEKDLTKLLCVQERLERLKYLVGVAERAELALTEAVSGRDEGAATELAKIEIARGKGDAIRAEAATCIGQLAFDATERPAITVEVPKNLPELGADAREAKDPSLRLDELHHDFGMPFAQDGLRRPPPPPHLRR